jgi:crotonobetainyl-CoA:carnitine CoA-transferase CaiB-like acyl-CoA transferase
MVSGTLEGITVLDFTVAAVGPFCSRILADMGAEVIRVEWPRGPAKAAEETELGRFSPEGIKAGQQILFLHCNGGKQSLCVNLKEPRGLELVRALVKRVDVVVENFTPHVMHSYGLDYPNLKALNPGIIMCSLTGYGRDGIPGYPEHPCTDPVAQAMGGLTWITGERNGPPYAIGGGIGDTMTSMAGAIAILSALVHRQRSGVGQYIDVSMVATSLFVDCTTMPYVAANNGGNKFFRNGQLNTYTCPMGPFKAKQGYISLQAAGQGRESAWGRLCIVMGREDLIEDSRYRDDRSRIEHTKEVIALIEHWLQSFSDDEAALAVLADARISSGPVLSQEQILEHPLFTARGSIQMVDYPELGTVKVVEPPYTFSDTPAYVRGPAPQAGEHNHLILKKHLGLSEEEIMALTEQGILYESRSARRRRGAPQEARR